MIHRLALVFRGISVAFGVTTLPLNAPPEKERRFVAAWFGIVGFFALWIAILLFIFTR